MKLFLLHSFTSAKTEASALSLLSLTPNNNNKHKSKKTPYHPSHENCPYLISITPTSIPTVEIPLSAESLRKPCQALISTNFPSFTCHKITTHITSLVSWPMTLHAKKQTRTN
jgi:hypothetical protein